MRRDRGSEEHLALNRIRIETPKMDLRPLVRREERERPSLKLVHFRIIIRALLRQREEQRHRKRSWWGAARSHAWHDGRGRSLRRLSGRGRRQTETNDAIDVVEIRAITVGDSTEVGEVVVVAELNYVVGLKPFQVRIVRIPEHESLVRHHFEGRAQVWVVNSAVLRNKRNGESIALCFLICLCLRCVFYQRCEISIRHERREPSL
mmetsp:Transcript_5957/g.20971  ORF Transcript_5957/g.20971 Transcript_5957/m.20971 type:complete len:206 (-) Transcript_5957:242-859(-)